MLGIFFFLFSFCFAHWRDKKMNTIPMISTNALTVLTSVSHKPDACKHLFFSLLAANCELAVPVI